MVQFPENGSIYGCYGWGGMGSGVCVCVFNLGSRVCVFPCKGICVLATDSTVIWKWNENMNTWYEHDRAVIVLNLNSRMVFGFCPLNSCKAQSFFFLQQCPENTHSHTHTPHTHTHTLTHTHRVQDIYIYIWFRIHTHTHVRTHAHTHTQALSFCDRANASLTGMDN